jgi:hypothetical protein
MKPENPKNSRPWISEEALSAVCVITVLFILPQFGGVAMMIGAVIALAALVFLYPDRFRSRGGSLKAAIWLISSFAIAVAVAVAVSLLKGRWN